jgi:hypothetical protein
VSCMTWRAPAPNRCRMPVAGAYSLFARVAWADPADAFLQKTLKKVEMERDICQITSDDVFALNDTGEEQKALDLHLPGARAAD